MAQDAPKSDCALVPGTFDIWEDKGESDSKAKKVSKPSIIPAVEIEHPGCSYNPPEESHKDALAEAVAEEMRKVYKDELGPEPVPLTVPSQGIDGEDEENMMGVMMMQMRRPWVRMTILHLRKGPRKRG